MLNVKYLLTVRIIPTTVVRNGVGEFVILFVLVNVFVNIIITIPEISLGIEWNGIVHYKPIYGKLKLAKIQQRDAEKAKLAQEKGIHFIVIPDLVSTEQKVREAFLSIVPIVKNLTESKGIEPL